MNVRYADVSFVEVLEGLCKERSVTSKFVAWSCAAERTEGIRTDTKSVRVV